LVRGLDALWDIKNDLTVGSTGPGTLDIESGGIVRTVQDVRLGDRFGGERGDVAVLGIGSLLAVGTPTAGALQVGVFSPGGLRIETGGDVYSYGGSVGDRPVLNEFGERIESGTVAIIGEGSLWDVRAILWVGRNGEGVIDVQEGGLLDVGGTLEIGGEDNFETATSVDGGKGLVRADGAGSRVVAGRVMAGVDGEGRLDALHGAQVDLTSDLYVGGNDQNLGNERADGLVTIRSDAALSVRDVFVGNVGEGEVFVSDGGTVESDELFIGYQVPDSIGRASATITGPSSSWTLRQLSVGGAGPGDFVVANGGLVVNVSTPGVPGQSNVNPTGTARVSGPFSRWQSVGLAVFGQLTIEAGGSITSAYGSIASTGSASVTQGGSRWDIPQLGVAGTLAVANGGEVDVEGELTIEPTGVVNLDPGGTVRADQLDNLGTVNANGGTLIVGGTIVVPEPGGGLAACVAVAAIAAHARRLSRRG
jgi:T5SS/PEP-CTERM-associated repeat protein